MSELMMAMEMPKCPVCGKPLRPGTVNKYYCGQNHPVQEKEDHYLSVGEAPTEWPKKGCPVCGIPMREAHDTMLCDQKDHFCNVTKDWYIENNR
jgi:ribosomal protein L32